ncbi:putative uncharacterized protein DDB_G0286901 isoform X2 [Eurosta solidaginis]
MVLTNFEWWAHGGAAADPNGLPVNSQNVDMFNPGMVQQRLNTATGPTSVSHISSNGYYGFSYVNAAHEPANNNDDQNIINLNNNNNNISNNNNNTFVPNGNDVNGMDVGVAVDGAAAALFSSDVNTTKRCKKRYFVSDDDYAKCELLNGCDSGGGGGVAGMGTDDVAVAGIDMCAAAKRCRFDDDYSAAQFCNDFFSLPSTQIGTQACLMDTEDTMLQQQQQHQQQVDTNMGAANINNQTTTTNTTKMCGEQTLENEAKHIGSILNAYENNNKNNDNTVNNHNNKKVYNNQVSKYTTINTTKCTLISCGSTQNERIHITDSDNGFGRSKQVGRLVDSNLNENTYHLNQTQLYPAFVLNNQETSRNHAAPLTRTEDGNEEIAGVATLYAKTHGGSFYQFIASYTGNQQYIEDI